MIKVTPPTNTKDLQSFQGKMDRLQNGINNCKPSIFSIVVGAVGLGVIKKLNNRKDV